MIRKKTYYIGFLMLNKILISIVTILLLVSFKTENIYKYNKINKKSEDSLIDNSFKQSWTLFAKAILNEDNIMIKKLSTPCINCSDCFMNTEIEYNSIQAIKNENPDKWFSNLYQDFIYINIDSFIKEDLKIIFDEKIKTRLLDTSKLEYSNNNHNSDRFNKECIIGNFNAKELEFKEVIVTYIDPSIECEGFQYAFAFIKINGQYKFCGFSTIP